MWAAGHVFTSARYVVPFLIPPSACLTTQHWPVGNSGRGGGLCLLYPLVFPVAATSTRYQKQASLSSTHGPWLSFVGVLGGEGGSDMPEHPLEPNVCHRVFLPCGYKRNGNFSTVAMH